MHKHIYLTEEEMEKLDDGQDWYKSGDDVILGGYMPDDDNENPMFSLSVNGYDHDNWLDWSCMPDWLRERLAA